MDCYSSDVLLPPSHSPDLLPSDYHLSGAFKRYLSGKWFHTDDPVIGEVQAWLHLLDTMFLWEDVYVLVHRWDNCASRV